MTTSNPKIVKKRAKNREIWRTVGPQGVQSRKNPIFWHFSSFFHAATQWTKVFSINDSYEKILKRSFNYFNGEGFPISSRSKYEGKWGKMGFLVEARKIFIQATKVTCLTWTANKNLHVATPKKGSKMTKKRGSKKGQKWPKMRVQKRVKKCQKSTFSSSQKMIAEKKN
jgi:hypothetical protein